MRWNIVCGVKANKPLLKQTDRETKRQRVRHTKRQTHRETDTQRDRHTERQTHRETDTQRDRDSNSEYLHGYSIDVPLCVKKDSKQNYKERQEKNVE